MHDADFGAAQEVGGAAEAVEHSGAHDTGAVCVGLVDGWYRLGGIGIKGSVIGSPTHVYVNFNRRVHTYHTQATDDLRRVRDLL